jgi:TetR/AcrR family transcriptional regulator, fatty acid metabolism regulator protein
MRIKEGNKEEEILRAAIKVFAEVGYSNAKISKIAEVANIATGSIYSYFENKEKILFTILKNIWEKLAGELENLSNLPNLSPTEKIEGMIDLVFDVFAMNPDMGIVFVRELQRKTIDMDFSLYYDKFLTIGNELLEGGKEQGYFPEYMDTKVTKYFFFGGVKELVHQWALKPDEFSINTIRQKVKMLCKYGMLKTKNI